MLKISKRLCSSSLIIILATLASSCASVQDIERDQLNHAAMDLKQNQTPRLGTPLTSLNSFRDSLTSGGCGSCAK